LNLPIQRSHDVSIKMHTSDQIGEVSFLVKTLNFREKERV
jgi:hypothetical protein